MEFGGESGHWMHWESCMGVPCARKKPVPQAAVDHDAHDVAALFPALNLPDGHTRQAVDV